MSVFNCFTKLLCRKLNTRHHTDFRFNSCNVKDILSGKIELGSRVSVKGWIVRSKLLKTHGFVHIADSSSATPMQLQLQGPLLTGSCRPGHFIAVSGVVKHSPGRSQSIEMAVEKIQVHSASQTDPTNTVKYYQNTMKGNHTHEYLRQFLHLRCRTQLYRALMILRNTATQAVHQFYQDNGYIQVHTPILTSNDCEGAGETFKVSAEAPDEKYFFGNPVYLTVSGQLHLEVLSGAFEKVYTFNPAFRAEKSPGRRHLAEFYMIESEAVCTQSIEDVNVVMEDLVRHVTKQLLEKHEAELQLIWNDPECQNQEEIVHRLMEKPFLRMDYTEAIALLEKHNDEFKVPVKWGQDLAREHELRLVELSGEGSPVFVQHYPATIKPFYARANDDQKTVACVDLLVPGVGELCGGSLREDRIDLLQNKLLSHNLQHELAWYVDMRKYPSVPHGGFGLGFERYLMFILGINNIRDTIPFPRSVKQCRL